MGRQTEYFRPFAPAKAAAPSNVERTPTLDDCERFLAPHGSAPIRHVLRAASPIRVDAGGCPFASGDRADGLVLVAPMVPHIGSVPGRIVQSPACGPNAPHSGHRTNSIVASPWRGTLPGSGSRWPQKGHGCRYGTPPTCGMHWDTRYCHL